MVEAPRHPRARDDLAMSGHKPPAANQVNLWPQLHPFRGHASNTYGGIARSVKARQTYDRQDVRRDEWPALRVARDLGGVFQFLKLFARDLAARFGGRAFAQNHHVA